MSLIVEIIVLVVALAIIWLMFKLISGIDLKKLIANSIAGIIGLFILNAIGISIPITLMNVVIVALTGFIGLFLLVILYLLGI